MAIVIRPILPATTVADSGVYTINISDKQKLHALILEVTNVGGSTAGLNILDMLTNIKLVKDGTEEVIYGTGNTLHAIAHDCGVPSMSDVYNLGAGATQTFRVPLIFGNSLVDKNYYIDMANVNLMQLVITYAFTIAVTGFTTGTASFALYGIYEYDQPIDVYKGYMRTRQADSYTALASGNHTTLIPTSSEIASVHVMTNTYAGDVTTPCGNVLYRANQGDRVFWNDTASRLRAFTAALSPTLPWVQAATFVQNVPTIASFMHNVNDNNALDITKNQYSMLEVIQTNQSATGVLLVGYREVVS